MPPKKTNAARLLDELGIVYELHEAPYDEADLSATSMARALGVPPEEVFKTLVLRGDRTGVIEACVPAAAELNLKELAAASGNKHVEMVPLKEIQPLTGYILGAHPFPALPENISQASPPPRLHAPSVISPTPYAASSGRTAGPPPDYRSSNSRAGCR